MGVIWRYDEKGRMIELVGCQFCIGRGCYYSALSRRTETCGWCSGKGTLPLHGSPNVSQQYKVVRDNLPKRVRDW